MDDGANDMEQHASSLAMLIPLHNAVRAWWQWSRKESVHVDGRSYPLPCFYPAYLTIFKPLSVQRYSGAAKIGRRVMTSKGRFSIWFLLSQ